MQHTGVLEVATNNEEFEFGKSLFEKANAAQKEKWLRLMTKKEIKAEEPNLETEGGLLFTQGKDENRMTLSLTLYSTPYYKSHIIWSSAMKHILWIYDMKHIICTNNIALGIRYRPYSMDI